MAPADLVYGGVPFWKVTDDLMMEGTGLVSLTSIPISGPSHLPAVSQPKTIILGLGSDIRILVRHIQSTCSNMLDMSESGCVPWET